MRSRKKTSSIRAAVVALVGNLAIVIAKFVAAWITGSSALLSEAIHSLVDTGDGLVLLFGINRGSKPASRAHPFGHGQEIYFWTLIVAIFVFGIGGGLSVLGGVLHILDPKQIEHAAWTYAVLGISIVFEGLSFRFALREFRKHNRNCGLIKAMRASKDASTFAIVIEDSAAIVGLLIAFVGVTLSLWLGNPIYDAVSSVLIGILLGTVSLFLAYECRGLLIGESANPGVVDQIQLIASRAPEVEGRPRILTMHFGPEELLVAISLEVKAGVAIGVLNKLGAQIQKMLEQRFGLKAQVYVRAL